MKKLIGKMDLWLLVIMILLAAFGLIMIFSSSSVSTVLRYKVSISYFFEKQLIFLIIGFIFGFLFILRIPTKNYKYFIPFLSVAIVVLLAMLFVYGKVTNGAQSWYRTKSFSIQPTEFAKSIMIVFMAVYYNKINNKKRSNPYFQLIPLAFGIILTLLIFLQPDLGGAIIMAGIAGLIFMSIPLDRELKGKVYKVVGIGIVLAAIVMLFSGKTLMNSMQSSRLNFLKPCSRYTEDTGYQVCNGFIAIHNGGLFGVGLGNSSQKYLYLPESHTDFIFPIVCEELGALAGVALILTYIFLLYRVLNIAKNADNLRNSVLAYGTFLMILAHILVNLLGILGLIPLTGVPLPFLSYGGSFNLNIIIMLFVVERVAIENNELKARKKIQDI